MNFTLATAAHEPELRRLLREQPMPGWVRLAFACEPDWFEAHAVLGTEVQTIVATGAADEVLGCGVRAIRKVYVDRQPAEIGYLGGLRSQPKARGSVGLVQGYRFLRQLHEADRRVPFYVTTIVEQNRGAMRLLTSRRAGLPSYADQGRFVTSAIFFDARREPRAMPTGIEICRGSDVAVDQLVGFLREEGRRHLFFPVIDAAAFGSPQWRGLSPENFRVARRAGTIVGVAAAWDQMAFRQTIVADYAPALRLGRPLINAALRFTGRAPLPHPGEPLSFFHLAGACVTHDDPAIFRALLERIHSDHCGSRFHCFVLGLHEHDPLRAALRGFTVRDYHSRIFLVCWDELRTGAGRMVLRGIPHLETGAL